MESLIEELNRQLENQIELFNRFTPVVFMFRYDTYDYNSIEILIDETKKDAELRRQIYEAFISYKPEIVASVLLVNVTCEDKEYTSIMIEARSKDEILVAGRKVEIERDGNDDFVILSLEKLEKMEAVFGSILDGLFE